MCTATFSAGKERVAVAAAVATGLVVYEAPVYRRRYSSSQPAMTLHRPAPFSLARAYTFRISPLFRPPQPFPASFSRRTSPFALQPPAQLRAERAAGGFAPSAGGNDDVERCLQRERGCFWEG